MWCYALKDEQFGIEQIWKLYQVKMIDKYVMASLRWDQVTKINYRELRKGGENGK